MDILQTMTSMLGFLGLILSFCLMLTYPSKDRIDRLRRLHPKVPGCKGWEVLRNAEGYKSGKVMKNDVLCSYSEIKSSLLDYPVYHTGYETFYFMETFIDKEFKFNIPTSSYPLYHSAYELFHLFKSYIDPGFKYSLSVGQFWGEMARRLADSLVLPLNVREYATALQGFTDSIEKNFGALMAKNGVSLDGLKSAVGNFTVATENFEKRSRTINRKNPIAVRAINDQMMQLERAFIDPQGLPDRPLMRHIVFAPSSHDGYSGVGFPGLLDALWEIEKDADPAARWEKVKEHLSVVIFTVQSAASTLDDVTSFQRQ